MNKVTSYLKNTRKSIAYATVDVSKNIVPEVSDFIDTNKDVLKSIYSTVRHTKTSVNYAKKLAADNRIYKDINKGIDNVFSDIKTGNFYNKEREDEYIDKTAESWLGDFDDDFDFDFDDDDNSLDEFQDNSKKSSNKSSLVVANSVTRSSNLSAQLISKTVANTSKSIMTAQINSANMIIAQNAELMAGLRTSVQGIHESVNQILRFNAEQVTTQINNESQFFESTTGILKENNSILKEILDIQKSIYKNNSSESGYSSDTMNNIFNGSTVDLKEYIKVIGKNLKNLDSSGTLDMLTSSTGDQSMLGSFLSNPLGMVMTGIVEKFMPRNAVKSISNFSKSLGALFPAMISKLNKSKNMGGIGGLLGSILGVNIETKKTIDTSKYNKGAVAFDGITRKAIVDVIPEHLARIESLISGKSQRIYDYNNGKWTTNAEIKQKQAEEEGFYIKSSYGDLNSTINNFINNLQKEKILSYKDKQNLNEDIIELMRPFFEQGIAFSSADARREKNKKDGKYKNKFKNAEMIDALLDVFDNESSYKQISTASEILTNKRRYADFLRDEERKGDSLSRKVFDNSMKDSDSINGILSLLQQGASSANSFTRNNENSNSAKSTNNTTEKKFNDFYYNPAADVSKGLKNVVSDTIKKSAKKENEDYDKYGGFFNTSIWKSIVDKIPGDSFIKKSLRNPGTLIAGLVESADKSIYNFLFDTDTGIVDPETNENIKGIFNSMLNGMKNSWTSLTEELDKRILEPLEEKFGLKTKMKEVVNKLVGEVQKDEKGNIIKNEYGFASRSGGRFTNTLTALQRKYRTGQKFVKDSITDVFIKDPQVAMLESDLNNGRYDLNNIDDITALQTIINGLTEDQKKKISKTLKEKLIEYGIVGFAKGGKAKLRKHNNKNKSGKVVKPGIIEVSQGEQVTVNSDDTEDKQKQNEQKETNQAFEYLKHSATGKSVEGLKAKIKENKTANGIFDKIKAIISDMNGKGSELGADSIIGGGAGLLVGGPVLGALLGASVSIIKNSQTAQKIMFGERNFDENGYITEQKGGLINKNIQNTFKKYVPDMGKYGIAGMASSLILPFGPLGGAVLGAGVGLLKNSQTMNEMIFGKDLVDENGNVTGKDNSGLLTPDRINKIKKGLPKAAVGALSGMVLGPFGLLGNAAIGAGVGLITGTNEFKDLIFGKVGPDGERYGGLKGALDDNFVNPLKDFGTDFKDDFFGFIKQEMIDPLNEAITPITNEIGYQVKRIIFGLPKTISDTISAPLMAILNDKIINPVANLAKGAFGKAFNFGKGVISAPFKGIRALGNRATKKQIRRGNTVNMSAAQRLQFRETHKMGEDKFSALDRDMVEMSQEQIEEYDSTLNAIDQGDKYFDKEMYKVKKKLSKIISDNLKEGKITGGVAGKVRKAIKNDDIDGALTLLSEAKKTRNGGKLSDDDYNKIANELKNGAEDYRTIKLRRDQFGEKQKTIANDLNEKYGIDVNNKTTLKALINNFDEEAKRVKARNDIEKSMENPEDLVTKGDEGIIEQLKLLREDIKNIINGKDILSSDRQSELDSYSNKADASISKNLSRRVANNKEISKKTGFSDTDIIGLFAINKNLYNTVLKAQGKGVYFSTDNVRNLSKLNKQQLKVIDKLPYLGLLDLNIMKKYTDKHRDKNKASKLNTSIKSGVDINSLDEAAMVTDPNTNANDHKKRAEYYNKLNQLGLVGDKISKEDILSRNGATYAQMDKLIKDQEKLNKLKDDENIDDQETKNSTTSGTLKDKIKTVFTEHGPISYILNRRGEYKKVNSKQNIETQKEADRDNDERKGIISSLSGIKDSFLGFFGKKKDDKDSDKKSWWEKLLDNPVTNAVKKVATVGTVLFGIGKLAEAWTNEGDNGTMHTIVKKAKQVLSPITDWLTGSGNYEGKGLPGWFSNTVLPGILNGTQFVFENVLPKLAETIVSALPTIISGVVKGLSSMLGIGTNSHKNDNTGTDKDFGNSFDTLTWNGVDVYDKDGNNISAKTDTSKLTEFYTNKGVKYSKDSNGNWTSEKGSTTRTNRDTLLKRTGKAFVKASLTGNTGVNIISGIGKGISKIPFMKNAGNAISAVGTSINAASGAGGIVNSFGKAVAKNTASGSSIGKAIKDATKSEGPKVVEKVKNFIQNIIEKIFGNKTVKEAVKEGLAEAGKESTEKAAEEGGKKVAAEVSEKVVKEASSEAVEKLSTKASTFIASGGLSLTIEIAAIVKDFIWGFDQAKAILGIDQVSFAQRFLSGIVNALNNFLFLGIIDSTTVVNFLAGPILALFGQDSAAFKKQQTEADKIVDQYNTENGTNYSKSEYYKNQTATGKIDNFISDSWQNIKSAPGKALSWVKGKIGVTDEEKKNFTSVQDSVKNTNKAIADWTKNKLSTGSELLKYAKNVVKDVFADAFAGKNVTTEGVAVDKDDPLKESKRVIYQLVKIIGTPVNGIVGAIKAIGKTFGGVIDGFKTVGSTIGTTTKTLFTETWNGDITKAFGDNTVTTKTGNGLIDGTSNIANYLTKVVLAVPGLLTFGIGKISNGILKVIDEFKTVGSNAATMVSNLMKNAVSGEEDPIDAIFTDKDDAKTGNELVDGVSKVVNSAIKIPLTPISLLTYTASSFGKAINTFIGSLKGAGTLTSEDSNILTQSKNAKITPFSTKYWKITNKLDGAAGWLYTFNSFMSKVLNLPTALLAMINPKNWLSNATDWLADKAGVDMSEFEGSSSSKKSKSKVSGKGTMSETGFVSQLDPKFKNKKFNTGKDSETQTLGDSGCAPATAANVLNLYAGKGSVMDNASNAALKYKDTNSGVTPDYFQSYLGSNGIGTYSTMNKNEMLSGISQGRPTVLLGSDPTNRARTPYGSASSHYVLATGLDGKGNVIIQDPESKRPNSLYPVRDVIKQTTLGMITGKGSMNARDLRSKVKAKLGKVGFGRGSNTVNQDLAKWSPITEGELNSAIRRLAGSNRGFSGKGKYFIEAANASGLDPRYILAHAAIESAWGDSNYAKAGNFFGIGAFDSNPDNAYNYGNDSMESGLINGAKWIRKNFYDAGQTTLYKMRHNGGSHEYATDPDWDTKIANVMDNLPVNSSASYHEAGDDSTSSSSSSSSSGYSGLLDSLDDLVFSYYSDDSKNFLKSLFGLDSSSSSDSSDDGDSSSSSSSYSGDAKTAQEFYNKYNGVAVDYDNAYGAQCVDLFKQYSDDVLGLKGYVVPGDGGARNIATDSRLNSYYDKVSLKDAKYGDWVIWDGSQGGGWGHVAMYTGMDSNGNIKAFGTNQGGPSGAANTVSVTSNGVAAVLRPKISGKGSGKYKSTAQYQSLPTNMLNNYRRKSVSVPSASKQVVAHMSGTGTSLPSLSNYSLTSDNSTLNSNSYSAFGSSGSSVSNNTRIENLISVVIDVLRIIADNSSKLSEIVTLLSKALDVNLTNDDIQSLSSNNAQIKNKIANALKAQGSPNGMGSAIMNSSTESLANALYTIARA